jgi:DNA polymerase III delta prime subunit
MILYGPDGAGKKTRAYAFLARIFGDHVFKLK